MQIRDHNRFGPLEASRLSEFERRHGLDLPADYRSFLLAYHGGVPVPADFYIDGPRDKYWSGIESFYGLGEQRGYHLEEWIGAEEIPSDMLVIGDDGCGGHIAVGICGAHRGAVFYLDHGFRVGEPQNAVEVASSFNEFLASLKEPTPSAPRSVGFEDAIRWAYGLGFTVECDDPVGVRRNISYEEFVQSWQRKSKD